MSEFIHELESFHRHASLTAKYEASIQELEQRPGREKYTDTIRMLSEWRDGESVLAEQFKSRLRLRFETQEKIMAGQEKVLAETRLELRQFQHELDHLGGTPV